MKPEDEQPSEKPTEEELREAAALAVALEKDAGAGAPTDALETAVLLRHARAPIAVPPAHEPIAAAQAAPALDARRKQRRRRRGWAWIAMSVAAPAAAAGWLFFARTAAYRPQRIPPKIIVAPPAPSAGLLAAQAAASRGGTDRAALARLDLEMRAYRRLYHDGLRRGHGGAR